MTDQTSDTQPASDNWPEDVMIPITYAQAIAACEALGLDPAEISEIRIEPHWVYVTHRDGERRHPLIAAGPPPAGPHAFQEFSPAGQSCHYPGCAWTFEQHPVTPGDIDP